MITGTPHIRPPSAKNPSFLYGGIRNIPNRLVLEKQLAEPEHLLQVQEIRHFIYTTNTSEGFNRQLRKVTKAKTVFPTDDSLVKMLYLAMVDFTKRWTWRRQD